MGARRPDALLIAENDFRCPMDGVRELLTDPRGSGPWPFLDESERHLGQSAKEQGTPFGRRATRPYAPRASQCCYVLAGESQKLKAERSSYRPRH